MAETITLRPQFGIVLSVITDVIIVVCLVALVVQAEFTQVARFALPLVTVGYLVTIVFWTPAVDVSDGGVRLRNVFRTISIPWAAIERIETKYALTLYTSCGRFAAWAAPASGRHRMMNTAANETRHLPESTFTAGTIGLGDVPRTDSGDAAAIVRRRWDTLRDAGYLSDSVIESDLRMVAWNLPKIVILGLLMVASAVGLALF
jgi:hypothetical protein